MPANVLFYGFKRKRCVYYLFTRSDQPGHGPITRDGETKQLLLNASRLQCDMFAVLSSSDVWPTVIHFKHLACVALSPAQTLSCSPILVRPQLSRKTDTLFSLTPSFLSPVTLSCLISVFPCFCFNSLPVAVLPLCISIFRFACSVMRSDPPCWMILT